MADYCKYCNLPVKLNAFDNWEHSPVGKSAYSYHHCFYATDNEAFSAEQATPGGTGPAETVELNPVCVHCGLPVMESGELSKPWIHKATPKCYIPVFTCAYATADLDKHKDSDGHYLYASVSVQVIKSSGTKTKVKEPEPVQVIVYKENPCASVPVRTFVRGRKFKLTD
jgi:hypothetical protein